MFSSCWGVCICVSVSETKRDLVLNLLITTVFQCELHHRQHVHVGPVCARERVERAGESASPWRSTVHLLANDALCDSVSCFSSGVCMCVSSNVNIGSCHMPS